MQMLKSSSPRERIAAVSSSRCCDPSLMVTVAGGPPQVVITTGARQFNRHSVVNKSQEKSPAQKSLSRAY